MFLGNVLLVLDFFFVLDLQRILEQACAHLVVGEVESSVLRDATLLQKSAFEKCFGKFFYRCVH